MSGPIGKWRVPNGDTNEQVIAWLEAVDRKRAESAFCPICRCDMRFFGCFCSEVEAPRSIDARA